MESRCLFCSMLAEFWQFGDMCQVSHGTILLCPIVFDRCVWCPWGTQTEGVVFCLCKVLFFAFVGVQCLVVNVVLDLLMEVLHPCLAQAEGGVA